MVRLSLYTNNHRQDQNKLEDTGGHEPQQVDILNCDDGTMYMQIMRYQRTRQVYLKLLLTVE